MAHHTDKKPSPSVPAAAPNLIVNGGFEVPVAQAFLTIVAPSSFAGWTVSTGGVDVSAASFYASASGAQSLDLNSIVSGSVSQDIATTAGVTYVLTFSFAANPLAGNPCCPARRPLQSGWKSAGEQPSSARSIMTPRVDPRRPSAGGKSRSRWSGPAQTSCHS